MPRALAWYAIAAAVLAADYATKLAVLATFAPGEVLRLAPFFNLTLGFNTGAAFSFLAGAGGWQTLMFAGIAVVASILVAVLIWREPGRRLYCAALALILGGALGNLHDRVVHGKVVDFLDFHALGWHWPAFNVADAGITVGAALLILESFLHRDGEATHRGA